MRLTEPLRQGDVLEAVDAHASKWCRHLLVITADCDFARDKHHGRVTCVPLLTADEYLLEMQIPRLRERFVKRPVNDLVALAKKTRGSRLSEQRAREWASESSPQGIVAALGLSGADAEKALGSLRAIRLIDGFSPSADSAMQSLVDAQLELVPPVGRDLARNRVVDPIRQAYTNPPGDALFLSAIGDSFDEGYFAYLRHLEQVSEPSISLGSTRRDATYRRISRLKERYTYALVQRFAAVFQSIGLPNEYEELRDLHSEYVGGGLT